MTAEEWMERFAAEIGLPAPDPGQVEAILELAATAAHASERIAAPVACYLAGVSGRALSDLNDAASRVDSGGA
jgi:hypothetical protein